jgi:23S rRNA (cytosine1962-C5)-methyltransferase
LDTMSFLNQMEDSYDLIILDPPAFAKHLNVRHNAVQGYKRLNALAMKKIAKNGILFTFSCSQVVDRKLFEDTIMAASIESGRNVKILHHLSQPADHPVSIYHPEGEYLKGLVVYVE